MNESTYTIQELTDETGFTRRTVHFYTQQGILPPPAGAGLGARYGEAHLLRLRLVPVLRRQGLRLDAIRERFAAMSLEEMRRTLKDASQPAAPDPAGSSLEPLTAQPHAHYRLPAGVTILAPAELGPADRSKLSALLEAAARIFGSGVG